MHTLDHFKAPFNSVGWFIPPYVMLAFLGRLAKDISVKGSNFTQSDLEAWLSQVYSPDHLAAMVSERYSVTPYINEYQGIIAQSVEAHFLGLDHVAVSGLMPVIEGAGKKIAKSRDVPWVNKSSINIFIDLAEDCKADAIKNNLGAVGEVVSMIDSFTDFAKNHLYISSDKYPLPDNTNRHGILHGAFSDVDYGKPINFYKAISAIDFLCFISAFRANISWLAPNYTERARSLSKYYSECISLSKRKPYLANCVFNYQQKQY